MAKAPAAPVGGERADDDSSSSSSDNVRSKKNNNNNDDDSSDDDDDKPEDIRSINARRPAGPPRPPTGGGGAATTHHRKHSSSGSEGSDDDDEAKRKAAALEQYKREEEEERAREASKKNNVAKQAAQSELEAASSIADDFDDSDMKSAPQKGSSSGIVAKLSSNSSSSASSDLQATMKDKKFKEKVKSASTRFTVGYADTIGKRSSMEDKLVIMGSFGDNAECDYFAVFDGHGSADTAMHCNKSLHKHILNSFGNNVNLTKLTGQQIGDACRRGFSLCQAEIEANNIEGGNTAIVALVLGRQLWIANLGDARAVLVDAKGAGIRASYDHKPYDPIEEARVVSKGGTVVKTRTDGVLTARVNNLLAVSRSLGDNSLRKVLSDEPQMHGPFKIDDYQALVLACDGVWDVVSDNTVARLCTRSLNDVEQSAILVRDKAYTRGSKDNISVVVVKLK